MEPAVWKRKVNWFLIGIVVVVLLEQGVFSLAEHQGLVIFALSALTLIPLAGFLESAVEELAELLGPFIGGLLHTTCSNIAELTISLALLLSVPNGADVVTNSIAGVVVRNSLLFLGLATFIGCLQNGKMRFSARNAGEYSTLFTLAVIGVGIPTLGYYLLGARGATFTGLVIEGHAIALPILLAIVLLLIYVAYIGFVVLHVGVETPAKRRKRRRKGQQGNSPLLLRTQPETAALFAQERERAEEELEEEIEAEGGIVTRQPTHARALLAAERRKRREEAGEKRVLDGHPILRGVLAGFILIASTALVALMSEAFAGSVETVFHNHPTLFGQPTENLEFFLGLIFIPVLAGLVELYGSVGMARENKMEIAIAVTAGATIQMILLIVPVIILVGAFTGHPLTLVFAPITVIIFGAATFTFMLLSRDGESTVLEGAQLSALWLLIAVIAIFLPPGVVGA